MLSAKLRIVGGADGKDEIGLQLPATVGRSQDNRITLTQPLVSRRHCEIFADGDQLWVRDLGSTNGTYVGSSRIDGDFPLRPGELLTVGTVTFRALYGESRKTDASGFLLDAESMLDEETVKLSDVATLVEPRPLKKSQPRESEISVDAEM